MAGILKPLAKPAITDPLGFAKWLGGLFFTGWLSDTIRLFQDKASKKAEKAKQIAAGFWKKALMTPFLFGVFSWVVYAIPQFYDWLQVDQSALKESQNAFVNLLYVFIRQPAYLLWFPFIYAVLLFAKGYHRIGTSK